MSKQVYTDVMVDLETLDLSATSVILSIGAVMFNARDPNTNFKQFYLAFGDTDVIKDQRKKGRTISDDTLSWWKSQSKEAKKIFQCKDVETLETALLRFESWINENRTTEINLWGNGATFDNSKLEHAYLSLLKREAPWKFWNSVCYRTMKNNFGHLVPKPKKDEKQVHNALYDAELQARHLVSIYSALQKVLK